MDDCTRFRERLARELAGSRADEGLRELAWEPHALACAACRELLAAEEELELLLDRAPADTAEAQAPTDLAARVLAGLRAGSGDGAEETALDRLLGRDPAPRPPVGLAGRVLHALEPERTAHRGRPRRRLQLLAAAAAVVLALVLGRLAFPPPPRATGDPMAALDPADREVVEALDVLEEWELLMGEDVDLLLSSLDVADELVLEMDLEPDEPDDAAGGPAGDPAGASAGDRAEPEPEPREG